MHLGEPKEGPKGAPGPRGRGSLKRGRVEEGVSIGGDVTDKKKKEKRGERGN